MERTKLVWNDQSLYGDSNVLQGAMWIEEKDGRTIIRYLIRNAEFMS